MVNLSLWPGYDATGKREAVMRSMLIVGGGSIGERHLRCFLKTGRVEVSVCEQRTERLKQLAGLYPVKNSYESFEAIDLARFDGVVICVSADLHVPWALRAAEAGAHVLIEKPLSVDLKDIDRLQATVEKKKLVAGVAHVRRAMPAGRALKEAVDSGRIGDVLSLTWLCGYDHRVARPDYLSTYWASRATGGGAVLDMSSHTSNFIQWLLGPIQSVLAAYDHLQMEGTPCEDTLSYILRFRNNRAIATVHCVAWQAHRSDLLTLNGVKGAIVCNAWEGRMGIVDRGNNWTWTEGLTGTPDARGQVDEPFVYEAENFLNAIEGKAQILCTLAEGKHTMEICEATYESGRCRAEVAVPQ
jgi:predicted dehydrogenase